MNHGLKAEYTQLSFENLTEKQKIDESKVGPITHMDLVRYSGASGDFNPIHTDPEFAKSVGLNGTIAHGLYVMGQLGKLLTKKFNPKQLISWNVKFKDMTFLGETLVLRVIVKKKTIVEGEKHLYLTIDAISELGSSKVTGEAIIKW